MVRTWIDWSCEDCGRPQALPGKDRTVPLCGWGSGCKFGIRLSEKVCFELGRRRDGSHVSGDSRQYLGRLLVHTQAGIQNRRIVKAYGAQGELCLIEESLMVRHWFFCI